MVEKPFYLFIYLFQFSNMEKKRLKDFNSWRGWRAVRNHGLPSIERLSYTCTHREHKTCTGLSKYKTQKTCTEMGMMGFPIL